MAGVSGGVWVDHQDFDELMLLLMQAFELKDPNGNNFTKVLNEYQKTKQRLLEGVEQKHESAGTPDELASSRALQGAALWAKAWRVADDNPDEAERHFEKLLEEDPTDAGVLCDFATFLKNIRENHDRAEAMHERSLEADPKHPNNLGNFANFLKSIRKDHDRAEAMYERAIEADPEHAALLANFASFLTDIRKDHDRAEAMYERAIEADPSHANIHGNFAIFLKNIREDHDRAETMYERAIEADPKHANALGNLAQLLFCRGETERARDMLTRAEAANGEGDQAASLEIAFYQFAHGPESARAETLSELRRMLSNEIRSPGWDLSGNVKRVIEDGFRRKTWLPKLAAVIADEKPISTLDRWAAWKKARPDRNEN